jgi:hypothetical protein
LAVKPTEVWIENPGGPPDVTSSVAIPLIVMLGSLADIAGPVKVGVMTVSFVIFTVHEPVPEHPPPDHPTKVEL